MSPTARHLLAVLAAAAIGATACPAAFAETPTRLTTAERFSGSVTVKAVDMANRRVTLTSAEGEDVTMDVPEEYHNLGQLKPGDIIKATYVREAEIKVSPRNARTPDDAASLVTARAPQGERPTLLLANQIVVTGAVLGIDMDNHTLRLASPQGGEVLTVPVTRPEGREAMGRLKVGDRVTATITEGLLLAAETPPN